MAKDDMTRTPLKRCSFCGKTERQVMRMVAGAQQRLHLRRVRRALSGDYRGCNAMMHSGPAAGAEASTTCRQAAEMKQVLDDYVIGQEHAKRALCVAVYNHYKRIGQRPGKDDVELQRGTS